MTVALRPLEVADLAAASALCLRSKGHWGYDADFLEACRDELTLKADHLRRDRVTGAFDGDRLTGVAQVSIEANIAELEKLFVDTDKIGSGVGRILFDWAIETARAHGAAELFIDADPGAAPFYERMGCRRIGDAPSASIPGRTLPRYMFDLTSL